MSTEDKTTKARSERATIASGLDESRWAVQRRGWLCRHVTGCVLFPGIVALSIHKELSFKSHPNDPAALMVGGLLMILFSVGIRWKWLTDEISHAPPVQTIKDAPSEERVLVSGLVALQGEEVVGPVSGRRGVYCEISVQGRSYTQNGYSSFPTHTREWRTSFLLKDGSQGSLRLRGRQVSIYTELSRLTIIYKSNTGLSGLPDAVQSYIQANKILHRENVEQLRVVETVLGEGDALTIVGRLGALQGHTAQGYRAVGPAVRELLSAELLSPMSLNDVRRMIDYRARRSALLTLGVFLGLGLLLVGVAAKLH